MLGLTTYFILFHNIFIQLFIPFQRMAASCKHHLNGKTSTTELLRRLEVAPSCSEPKDNSTRLEPDIALIHDKYV
jgi:hypothetical protein